MLAEAEINEYLSEIRERVCSRCVERPPGGPPCEPLGKVCGVEEHLPELIESIHQVQSKLIAPYQDRNRAKICASCSSLGSDICPCPMDYLLPLIVEAVETVDDRRGVSFAVKPPVESPSQKKEAAGLEEIREAFKHGQGQWTGCDWPTRFGPMRLNLEGWTAERARALAMKADSAEIRDDFLAASHWLLKVEQHAHRAETEAKKAVAAAEEGEWLQAFEHAELAWSLEMATGRASWKEPPWAWQDLYAATDAAFFAQDASVESWL